MSQKNRDFWEGYQKRYKGNDYGYHWGGEQVLQIVSDACKEFIKGKSVLEIGGGGGKWTKALFDRMGASSVWSTDVHSTAVKAIKDHEQRAKVTLEDGKGINVQEIFDLVFSYDVFLHLPPSLVLRYIKDARRVSDQIIFQLPNMGLMEGARLFNYYAENDVFEEPYTRGYMNFYTSDMVKEMARIAGGKCEILGHVLDRDTIYKISW